MVKVEVPDLAELERSVRRRKEVQAGQRTRVSRGLILQRQLGWPAATPASRLASYSRDS